MILLDTLKKIIQENQVYLYCGLPVIDLVSELIGKSGSGVYPRSEQVAINHLESRRSTTRCASTDTVIGEAFNTLYTTRIELYA